MRAYLIRVVDAGPETRLIVGIAAHGKVHFAIIGCWRGPASISVLITWRSWGRSSFGGAKFPSGIEHAARITPINLSENSVATSAAVRPLPLARLMILSSTSVSGSGRSIRPRSPLRDEPATNHVKADERAGIADVDVVDDRGATHYMRTCRTH